MDTNQLWRERITGRCGGADFDASGGGYAFSAVLAEERKLIEHNEAGNPGSALLALSIADPTWKMNAEAALAGLNYYYKCPDATRYTDNFGPALCPNTEIFKNIHELIVDHLNMKFKTRLTVDWVQYSPGAIKRALAEFIPTALLDCDTDLIFPVPGYPVIKNDKNRRGANIINCPMTYNPDQGWQFNLPTDDQLTRPKAVMYLNAPHNPTGIGLYKERWRDILSWAYQRNIILVVDEAYIDLCYARNIESVVTVPGWEDCCVVLQSISKGWSATGLRFGWMIGHPTIIKALREVTDVKDSGMYAPTIVSGATCLNIWSLADITKDQYLGLHTALRDGLRRAGFQDAKIPQAGLCQMTRAPKAINGQGFDSVVDCVQWLRQNLRISVMHYEINDEAWLRWAVTVKPVPECGLPTQESVIEEVGRRLQKCQIEF